MIRQPVLAPKSRTFAVEKSARVVLSIGNAPHARSIQDAFRQQGWEVHIAPIDADARRLVRKVRPLATVLCAEPPGRESGWLTCRKLLMEKPGHKVVLVSPNPSEVDRRLAEFVGAAALVSARMPHGVVKAAMGFELASVN